MVRVEMRHEQPRQPTPGERPRHESLPDLARCPVRDTRVEHRPSIAILDQVDVDVVQAKRQRNAGPQDAGGDFDQVPRGRRFREGKVQGAFAAGRRDRPSDIVGHPLVSVWPALDLGGAGGKDVLL